MFLGARPERAFAALLSAGNDIRFLHEQAEQKRDVRDPPALRLFVVRGVRVERAEGRCVENRMFGLFGLFVSNEKAVVFISLHLNL